ncbi:hypothetical protein C8R42DRAFT_390038 [Lentinula raphanica]|nr:hypothetical protein C8R42DRAFT_390038 [Lentinula raphanica]
MRALLSPFIRSNAVNRRWESISSRKISSIPPAVLPTKPLVGQMKPMLWLDDHFENNDYTLSSLELVPTIDTLHQLIQKNKLTTAHRMRCMLQDQGVDIPRDMIFLDAALGEINTLSSVTRHALYGWLHLIPSKHELGPGELNPFHSFGSLYRSGSPSQDLEVILGMVKIASSKGYFFEEFKRVISLMTRLVKPTSGLDLMLEFEKGHVDYIAAVEPQDVQRHAILAREALILGCCSAKGRWLRMALKLLKRSKREGIIVSSGIANLIMTLKQNHQVR